ncbi:MAG: hypothetical protein A2Y80_06910 [Deltaproteobacteria bacterium RBG_13_58_19]|nr:MAG: hypothetical protein A2Y80_06910 [Deltaproteobacteria bacterium RBG_13_58_19]
MAKAKLEWTPKGGSRQSYTLPVNFTWDYQELHQDDSDRQRALDGTLRSYAQSLKARWVLRFQHISTAQKEQLANIKQAQTDIDFFREATGPKTFTGAWINDLDFRETAPELWSGSMILEEV